MLDPMFFLGRTSLNLNLKNVTSTYTKHFSWKKMTQICQILKEKEIQITKFLSQVPVVSHLNVEGFWFSFLVHI